MSIGLDRNSGPGRALQPSRRGLVHWIAGTATLALAACSAPTPTPAPTAASTTRPAAQPSPEPPKPAATAGVGPAAKSAPGVAKVVKKVKLGTVPPFFFQAPIPYGKSKGFFEEEGIDLELVHFDGDPLALKALLAGEVDVSTYNASSQVLGAAKGDTKIFGSFQPLNSFVIAARKDIKTLKDLEGKTYAASAPKSMPQLVYTVLMEKASLDPSKVQLVGIQGGPPTLQAIAASKADAGMLDQSFVPLLDQNGAYVLSVLAESLPELLFDATAVSNKFLAANPDVLLGYSRAIIKSVRGAYDDRAGVVKEETERLKQDQKVVEYSFDQYTKYKVWSPDFLATPDQIAFMQQVNVKFELQDKTVPVEQVATWDFQKKALEQLGPYKPKA